MPEEPYRATYRAEVRDRDPTAAEEAQIARQVRAWEDARVRRQAQHLARGRSPRLAAGILLVVGATLLVLTGRSLLGAILLGALGLFALLGAAWPRGPRARRGEAPLRRGMWDAPPGGWTVRETRVLARSVVRAVSADPDYPAWLLYEIPGGEWFFMEGTAHDADYARAGLVLACLWPGGPAFEAEAQGDAIPLRGAVSDRDVDDASEEGRTWAPDADAWAREPHGVPERELPPWMLACAGREVERT